jgi:ABC-type transporter Mla MlaB component
VSKTSAKRLAAAKNQIVLPADLVNSDVEALRQTLLAALASMQPVEIQAADVTRAGTAALQLLLSFLRDAERKQVAVRLNAPAAPLLDALRCLGLDDAPEIRALL